MLSEQFAILFGHKIGGYMAKSEIIYIAKPNWYTEEVYPGYRKFYETFSEQLKTFHEVRALDLPDIWVRDFLPVQNVKTGQLYQTFFDPRYANYTAKFTAAIRKQVSGYFPQAKVCDVRIDGGNILITPDGKYAFCLEKQTIFKKSNKAQKEYVEKELKNALGVQEILWLPYQKGDKIGHIDGYIQFAENFLMEASIDLYDGITTASLLDYDGRKQLIDYCEGKNIVDYNNYRDAVAELICTLDEDDWLSAKGLYINFLTTSKAVFLPQFNLREDERALNTIKKYTSKPIVSVDCSKIAKYGGAVHCLTREYF